MTDIIPNSIPSRKSFAILSKESAERRNSNEKKKKNAVSHSNLPVFDNLLESS
jgi:hypothetical protein